MTEAEIGHVYTAMAEILKHLAVEKGGTLPSNMGSGAYITAEALSSEVKRKMVENNLILLSNETPVDKKIVEGNNGRNTFTITTRGEYTLISTVDGSQATISGLGDGVSVNTAVAANIASTFALKNALSRTFMVDERGVEENAMKEVSAGAPTERALGAATATMKPAERPAPKATSAQKSVKDVIRVDYIDSGKISREKVNEIKNALQADNPDLKGDDLMNVLLEAVKSEVG